MKITASKPGLTKSLTKTSKKIVRAAWPKDKLEFKFLFFFCPMHEISDEKRWCVEEKRDNKKSSPPPPTPPLPMLFFVSKKGGQIWDFLQFLFTTKGHKNVFIVAGIIYQISLYKNYVNISLFLKKRWTVEAWKQFFSHRTWVGTES